MPLPSVTVPSISTSDDFAEWVDASQLANTTLNDLIEWGGEVEAQIGLPLSDLETNAKTSLIDAINEVRVLSSSDDSASIGDINSLTTTAQSNLVAAVNELDGEIGALSTLTTDDKTSIVEAVNEIQAEAATNAGTLAAITAQLAALPEGMHSGTGVPSAGLGDDGDFYLDIASLNLYKKDSGAWSVDVNLASSAGIANEASAGIIEIASQAEANAAAVNDRAITPIRLGNLGYTSAVADALRVTVLGGIDEYSSSLPATGPSADEPGMYWDTSAINPVLKVWRDSANQYVGTYTIGIAEVSYANIQNVVGNNRILGNIAGANQDITELTAAQVRTLINVEDGATGDLTGSEIKALYEAQTNTNAFTDALQTKLNAITVTDPVESVAVGANLTLSGTAEDPVVSLASAYSTGIQNQFAALRAESFQLYMDGPLYSSPTIVTMIEEAPYNMVINELVCKLAVGAITLSLRINGANVTGVSGVAVNTSQNTYTATAANTVVAGQKIVLSLTGANSGDQDFSVQINATRTDF